MGRFLRCAAVTLFVAVSLLAWLPPSPARAADGEVGSLIDPPASPTEVKVDFLVINFPDIDIPAERFEVLAYLTLTWEDPRVLEQLPRDSVELTYLNETADTTIGDIWSPNIQFTNQYAPPEVQNKLLTVTRSATADGGETAVVTYNERLHITLQVALDLSRFPFDTQQFDIGLTTFGISEDDVLLTIGTIDFFSYEPDGDTVSIPEGNVFFQSDRERLPTEWRDETITSACYHVRSEVFGIPYQCIEIKVTASHDAGFYAWKILLPIVLIIGISSVAFWVPGEGIATRNYVSLFGLLTMVTFSFNINNYLPRMSDLTFLDGVVTGAYIFIVSAVVVNVYVHHLLKNQRETLVRTMDRYCRWLFPLLFLVFCGIWLLAVL